MASPFRAGLVGVTGYTGMELPRLLAGHDRLTLTRATSRQEAGKTLAQIYPHLCGNPFAELTITTPEVSDLAGACDVVFLAVPHGAAMELAGELVDAGVKVVDLSADFRLRDAGVYEAWYKLPHARADLLPGAVYGLLEYYRHQVPGARLVANPGCYPTSAVLALAPALGAGLVETGDIVIDAKSGTTGAGRKANVGTLFCEVSDNFRAYNLAAHRHTPEIEQELSLAAGSELTVSFNTHLLPVNRGILSTIYTRLAKSASLEEIREVYLQRYRDEPFVRVLPAGVLPEIRSVRGTMHCDIGLVKDARTNRLLIVSAIDNLCRGASGQALANANLMLGLDEKKGLQLQPLVP